MYSKAALFAFLSLAMSMATVSGNFVNLIRESDVSLTCERRGNPCLMDGPGDPEYEVLASLIIAALEEQEYLMDTKKVNNDQPEKNTWFYHDGEWQLEKPEEAAKMRAEAKKKYNEKMAQLAEKWGDLEDTPVLDGAVPPVRKLQKYHQELKAIEEEEKQVESLDSFVKNLFGADYKEEQHSLRRRLWSCRSGRDLFCQFYCKGRRRERQRQLRAEMERELFFGDNMCLYHTNLKEFLYKYPSDLIDSVKECVNEDSLCIMAYPCSI